MDNIARSSGISIPLFLRRKKERQQHEQRPTDSSLVCDRSDYQTKDSNDEDDTNENSTNDNKDATFFGWKPKLRLRPDQELTRDQTIELSNRVFTASELEQRIWKTQIAMFDIQRQLHRGEEIYYEDTHNHGSIYKGWDAFVDMKDIGTTSVSGGGGTQASSIRRVPADARWFSTSCGSVSGTKLPLPFPPPLLPKAGSSADKVSVTSQQARIRTSMKETSQSTTNAAATVSTESNADPNQSSSARIRQRATATIVAASSLAKSGTENPNSCVASSTSKANNPVAIPTGSGIGADPGSTKKKRKSTLSTPGNDDQCTTKINQKSADEETKRGATKLEGTTTGIRTAIKSNDDSTPAKGKPKTSKSDKKETATAPSNKSKKAEISSLAKREKEVEAPVPRKRGRPRRKT
mmetsp:Transcript_2872/g.7887  ORF Transcript_2872/g.7887 Transcript_2872/m.7887 type:complete len:408 (-) Transcript_2872:154-1377(-)